VDGKSYAGETGGYNADTVPFFLIQAFVRGCIIDKRLYTLSISDSVVRAQRCVWASQYL
jgi:hypothetical protein